MAVSAIIVTFHSDQVIDACLDALSTMAPEVIPIVLDNGSAMDHPGDTTVAHLRAKALQKPKIQWVENTENRGFAGAVNQGVRLATAGVTATPAGDDPDYFLILNPDANLTSPIQPLVDAAREHGIAAGRLTDAQGHTQAGFTIRRLPSAITLCFEMFGLNRLWKSNPVNRRYRYLDRDLNQPGPVEQPAGAFLLVRSDVWQALGGFDEGFYPLWFEDVDFCRRAQAAGYRIEYLPSVTANHAGGHSLVRLSFGRRAVYWCASLLRYAAKSFKPAACRWLCVVVIVSSIPRMLVGMLGERNLKPVSAYLEIVRFASLCLLSPRRIVAGRA